jgi:hypothetical protein
MFDGGLNWKKIYDLQMSVQEMDPKFMIWKERRLIKVSKKKWHLKNIVSKFIKNELKYKI